MPIKCFHLLFQACQSPQHLGPSLGKMFHHRSPPTDTSWGWSFSPIIQILEKALISATPVRVPYLLVFSSLCLFSSVYLCLYVSARFTDHCSHPCLICVMFISVMILTVILLSFAGLTCCWIQCILNSSVRLSLMCCFKHFILTLPKCQSRAPPTLSVEPHPLCLCLTPLWFCQSGKFVCTYLTLFRITCIQ